MDIDDSNIYRQLLDWAAGGLEPLSEGFEETYNAILGSVTLPY